MIDSKQLLGVGSVIDWTNVGDSLGGDRKIKVEMAKEMIFCVGAPMEKKTVGDRGWISPRDRDAFAGGAIGVGRKRARMMCGRVLRRVLKHSRSKRVKFEWEKGRVSVSEERRKGSTAALNQTPEDSCATNGATRNNDHKMRKKKRLSPRPTTSPWLCGPLPGSGRPGATAKEAALPGEKNQGDKCENPSRGPSHSSPPPPGFRSNGIE